MVGYAGSPTYTVYVDVTLTRSKVKVKVTGLLNFRQLAKPCMLAAMTAAPFRGFLVLLLFSITLFSPFICGKLNGKAYAFYRFIQRSVYILITGS